MSAPADVGAQTNLAWVLATCSNPWLRDGNRALHLARRAVEHSGANNPIARRLLAAAYAETGRFDITIQTADDALKLAVAAGDARLTQARLQRTGQV